MKRDKLLHFLGAMGFSIVATLLLYLFVKADQIVFLYVLLGTLVLIFGKEWYDTRKSKPTGFSLSDIQMGVMGLATGLIISYVLIIVITVLRR